MEFRNPLSVVACLKGPRAGDLQAIQCLAKSLARSDFPSRVRAAEALFEASKDGNGSSAILMEPDNAIILPALIKAAKDDSKQVKFFVFSCLAALSDTPDGSFQIVKYGGVSELLEFLQFRLKAKATELSRILPGEFESDSSSSDDQSTAAVLRGTGNVIRELIISDS